MTIELIRTLIDFGMVILIWVVQLVIYPSFRFYEKARLVNWHDLYTKRIAYVVMPLMISQLILYGYLFFLDQTFFNCIGFGVIVFMWLFTFFQFVPLHGKISIHDFSGMPLKKLVRRNWLRTALWTALFIFGLIDYISE